MWEVKIRMRAVSPWRVDRHSNQWSAELTTVALQALCQLSTGHRWRTSWTGDVVITGLTRRDKPTSTAHFHSWNWEFSVVKPTSTQQGPSRALNRESFVRSSEILVSSNSITLFLCDWNWQWWRTISHTGDWIISISKNASFIRFCKSPGIVLCCC